MQLPYILFNLMVKIIVLQFYNYFLIVKFSKINNVVILNFLLILVDLGRIIPYLHWGQLVEGLRLVVAEFCAAALTEHH